MPAQYLAEIHLVDGLNKRLTTIATAYNEITFCEENFPMIEGARWSGHGGVSARQDMATAINGPLSSACGVFFALMGLR